MSRMMRPLLTAAVLVTLATAPVGVLAQGSASGSADTGGMKVAEPYVVIVTAGEVPIRCGDSTFHYPIAQAKAGEALVVDGETSNWLRVKYPASIEPLVPVAEATEPVNNVIRLRVPSKLLAPNATGGARASFFRVLDADLPVNTELKVTRSLRSDEGAVTHYSVAAPMGARGWISRDAVRRATVDEATKAMAARASAASTTTAPAPVDVIDSMSGGFGAMAAPAATTTTTTTPPPPAPASVTQVTTTVTEVPSQTQTQVQTQVQNQVTGVSTQATAAMPAQVQTGGTEAATSASTAAPVTIDRSSVSSEVKLVSTDRIPTASAEAATRETGVLPTIASTLPGPMMVPPPVPPPSAEVSRAITTVSTASSQTQQVATQQVQQVQTQTQAATQVAMTPPPAPAPAPAPMPTPAPAPVVIRTTPTPPPPAPVMPAPAPVVVTQTVIDTVGKDGPVVPPPALAPVVIETQSDIPGTVVVDDGGKDGPVVSPSEIGTTFRPGAGVRTTQGGGTTVTTTTTTTTTGALVPGSAGAQSLQLNLNQIAETFNRVMRQPLATAELETAIAQIEAFRATLGSSERDNRLRTALQSYVDALRLRMEVRDGQRAGEAAARSTTLQGTELGQRVIELERQRIYNVIGRLVRSTVYDGDRVPLLYRVMSPEPGSARTLGYLQPSDKFDLTNKLEQVVGIIGEIRPEASLRTNLIVPRRVDVVSLQPIVVSPDIPGMVFTPQERTNQPPMPGVTPATPGERVPAPAPAEPPAGEPAVFVPEPSGGR